MIDGCLSGCGLACLCYPIWKDGMRDGRSIGKGMMGLRVVKYGTGYGATAVDSCFRNVCNFCVCLLCVTREQRHVGDYIAGTIVIKDQ
jgi:uncharacterized RDD family membrane protein YckC